MDPVVPAAIIIVTGVFILIVSVLINPQFFIKRFSLPPDRLLGKDFGVDMDNPPRWLVYVYRITAIFCLFAISLLVFMMMNQEAAVKISGKLGEIDYDSVGWVLVSITAASLIIVYPVLPYIHYTWTESDANKKRRLQIKCLLAVCAFLVFIVAILIGLEIVRKF